MCVHFVFCHGWEKANDVAPMPRPESLAAKPRAIRQRRLAVHNTIEIVANMARPEDTAEH